MAACEKATGWLRIPKRGLVEWIVDREVGNDCSSSLCPSEPLERQKRPTRPTHAAESAMGPAPNIVA
jgi:hypothetical protein